MHAIVILRNDNWINDVQISFKKRGHHFTEQFFEYIQRIPFEHSSWKLYKNPYYSVLVVIYSSMK